MRAWSYTFFYNLSLPTVCLSWQTAQTLMRHHVLRRLIWVYAVCICSFFACIQPVPQVRTLNFRLATPLFSVPSSFAIILLKLKELVVYLNCPPGVLWLLVFDSWCSVAFLYGAMGSSAVCDCGISWSYSLTFCRSSTLCYSLIWSLWLWYFQVIHNYTFWY